MTRETFDRKRREALAEIRRDWRKSDPPQLEIHIGDREVRQLESGVRVVTTGVPKPAKIRKWPVMMQGLPVYRVDEPECFRFVLKGTFRKTKGSDGK